MTYAYAPWHTDTHTDTDLNLKLELAVVHTPRNQVLSTILEKLIKTDKFIVEKGDLFSAAILGRGIKRPTKPY